MAFRPIIEEANKVAPAFSRIFKEMILVASKDKPLPRAGKGTVMRKAALTEYQNEIDEMLVTFRLKVPVKLTYLYFRYAKIEATANVEAVVPPTSWDTESVSSWLLNQISEIVLNQPISLSGDLFEQGLDR